jgi:hypothetical protein
MLLCLLPLPLGERPSLSPSPSGRSPLPEGEGASLLPSPSGRGVWVRAIPPISKGRGNSFRHSLFAIRRSYRSPLAARRSPFLPFAIRYSLFAIRRSYRSPLAVRRSPFLLFAIRYSPFANDGPHRIGNRSGSRKQRQISHPRDLTTWGGVKYLSLLGSCSPARRFWVVRCLLGSVLLGAVLRKLLFPAPPPWVAWGWHLPEGLWLAALEAEALVGLWLWWGGYPRLLWGVSLGWFSLLAGVSFWSAWQGAVSCGCLGSGLQVSPWVLLGVDLGAVALLLWARPAVEAAPRLGRAGLTALAGGLLLLGVALLGLGQLGLGLRELRGQEVVAVPAVWEVAAGEVGTEAEVRGWLRNVGQQVVQVLGGRGTVGPRRLRDCQRWCRRGRRPRCGCECGGQGPQDVFGVIFYFILIILLSPN